MNRNPKPKLSQNKLRIYEPVAALASDEKAHSKTDVRYWKDRLFKRSNDDWQVQIAFAGRQEKFPLGTPNKDTACSKARDIYLSLRSSGWEATIKKYKPWAVEKSERTIYPTVGQFLQSVRGISTVRPSTLETYVRKFRRLVGGVCEIASDKKKFDYVNGGSAVWRTKIDSVRLCDVKPEGVQKWKASFLQNTGNNPLKLRRARFTMASIIRCSKALFSEKKVLRHLRKSMNFPTPLPLEGVEEGKMPSPRYTSKIDAEELARTAKAELEDAFPESFKIFLLAFAAGLRREEIDALTWNQINWKRGTIIVRTHAYGSTKTESSESDIAVDPALLDHLRNAQKEATDDFVVRSPVKPRPGVTYHHYRCARHFRHLVKWLKKHGVQERNAIHVLRKEYGSQICNSAGIFAASVALRHSNIHLTREHYVDSTHRVSLPLGKMLLKHEPAKEPNANETAGSKTSPQAPGNLNAMASPAAQS